MPFWKEISNIFNWDYTDENTKLNHEGYKSNFSLEDKKRIDALTILKSMRGENANKLFLLTWI